MSQLPRIYLAAPHLGQNEQRYVLDAFDSNWVSTVGPNLAAFEQEMGERLGRHCVALSSGTAAIHLSLRMLGVGPGDEVWCPSLTFVASANPILYERATPVFLDSETSSWNLDPDLLGESLEQAARQGRLPKAVIVVDLFGQTADMDSIQAHCAKFEVPVLEDAAEALGGSYRGRPAGSFGQFAVLSFNGNKIITTSGGGMLLTDNREAAEKARKLAAQAREPGIAYNHSECGFNYRMSNVLAGIGRGQLELLDARVQQKRALFERYQSAFSDIVGFEGAPEAPQGQHTRWLSCFTLSKELPLRRDALVEALNRESIEARPVWKPMHRQELFRGCRVIGGSVADDLFERGICLPSGTAMTADDESRVVATVRKALRPTSQPVAARAP